jgi:hypothetical protein
MQLQIQNAVSTLLHQIANKSFVPILLFALHALEPRGIISFANNLGAHFKKLGMYHSACSRWSLSLLVTAVAIEKTNGIVLWNLDYVTMNEKLDNPFWVCCVLSIEIDE